MNKRFARDKARSLGKAALLAGAITAPLAMAGAATAQPAAEHIGPLKSDVCVTGPLGFVRGCVDTDHHRWWDGNRWWNGDRAWDGDDWHRYHDGPGWRHDNGRHRGWDKHDDWRHRH
ncbi:hypothetical protein [Segniliparus rugosus]|uniref:Uncharacterized protein n=1 Tax=Segniliparus rugosus (strain ATCC BAA-974 / DSM 45345 / CCUG 50838 / CIP 108380 / JCM 13579 / CDC 945) TaxID=679197 RepID=E5XP36_SEGRC|nr:hypothetical protein [Segniliparus rugosus]EFV13882.1 hypothetical protein HMPREF9336_01257 [Segniliparus rugosus ATCC BAA-974]